MFMSVSTASRPCHPRVARSAAFVCVALLCFVLAPRGAAAAGFATYQIGAGWATFGVALPQGTATAGVQVGSLPTQTDVKNRWPDGSIRFAVVTTKTSSDSKYDLSAGSNPGAASIFTPSWPNAAVNFTIAGVTYSASLPTFSPAKPWLTGPLVSEARVVVSPKTSGGTVHPLLQVVFDVRSYNDGKYRLDFAVQNVKDVPQADQLLYDVNVKINSATVWSKTSVTHWWGVRWRKTFYSTGFAPAEVTPDFEPFYRAGALPRFLSSIDNTTYTVDGPEFDILGFANMTPYMMTPGGRAEIGAYPWWEAQYLVHKTDNLRKAVLENGNHSGSWSMQVTEPDGESIIRLDTYPEYWFDGRGGVGHPYGPNVPRQDSGQLRGVRPDPAVPDNQHLPSVSFVPYLLTGDRFYLDQMRFWSAWAVIATYPGDSTINGIDFGRMQSMGLLAQNGNRGFAWPLREVADCAAYLPDGDPDKAYFSTIVANNLSWLDNYAKNANGGPLEAIFWERSTGNEDAPYVVYSMWQSAYLAFAVDRAIAHGFGPAGVAFRNRAIRSQIKLLTSDTAGYPRSYGAPYYPRVGEYVSSSIVLYSSMKSIWDHNYNPNVTPKPNPMQPIIGYYGPEARLLLTMGAREKIPGAQAALSWLLNYREPASGATVVSDVNHRAGFAVSLSDDVPPVPVNVSVH
jgi:hypothetical protein